MRISEDNRIRTAAAERSTGRAPGGVSSVSVCSERPHSMRFSALLFVLLAMAACVLGGCSRGSEKTPSGDKNYPLFYYAVDKDDLSMYRVEYSYLSDSSDGRIAELLQKLTETDSVAGRYPVIPHKLRVEKWELSKEGELSLSFSGEYESLTDAREAVLKAGVVLTMSQVATVNSVSFTINGEPLMQRQEPVGPMTATMFANRIGEPTDVIEVNLYFVNSGNYGLAPISRLVYPDDYKKPEQYLLEYLISGPTASEVTSIEPVDQKPVAGIPANTRILNLSTKKSTCYVNLSSEFLESERTIDPQLILHSIADTLIRNFDYIDGVVITVDGKALTTYRGFEVPAIFRTADLLIQ